MTTDAQRHHSDAPAAFFADAAAAAVAGSVSLTCCVADSAFASGFVADADAVLSLIAVLGLLAGAEDTDFPASSRVL